MPGVIVECTEHGFVESNAIGHSGGAQVVMVNSSAQCPICGRLAPIINGRYASDAGNNLRADLWLTADQADRLRAALIRAKQHQKRGKNEASTAQALEDALVETIPQARPILDAFKGQTSMALAAWIGVLITIVMFFLTVTNDEGVSEQDLERILDETVRAVQSERSHTEQQAPSTSEVPTRNQEPPPRVTELPTPETH